MSRAADPNTAFSTTRRGALSLLLMDSLRTAAAALPFPAARVLGAAGAVATSALAGACAQRGVGPLPEGPTPGDVLIDLRLGRPRALADLLAELRAAPAPLLLLLGELHDQPLHHARRAALLRAWHTGTQPPLTAAAVVPTAAFPSAPVVVVEHLDAGQQLRPGAAPLDQRLQAAGFDARAWPWQRGLLEAVDALGWPVLGGNLSREDARRLLRAQQAPGETASAAASGGPDGTVAWPVDMADLAPLLQAAPLSAAAQAALDQDLLDGHCGQLPARYLPAMRLAQRARDARLWQVLRTAMASATPADAAAALSSPAATPLRHGVLLAGNGHVRRDYGVAQLARVLAPQLRQLSVGFAEIGAQGDVQAAIAGASGADARRYDWLWLTPGRQRDDPCAELKTMTPVRPAR